MRKVLRTSWQYIRRSPYQALAAISVMTLSLFTSAVFILVGAGSNKILHYFEKRPQVIAFLKDEASKSEVDLLTIKLLSGGKVESLNYISKEDALKIYQEQNKNDPLLLEMVTSEILPASLEISTKEIGYLEEVANFLKSQSVVEEVDYQQDVIAVLQKITLGIRKVGLVLISFLMAIAFLIVMMVVGIKAANRRREIKIMKLIGATSWYIRLPFLVEGIFYGFSGAILAWLLAFISLLYATPLLVNFLAGISLLPVPPVFLLLLLAGLILGGVIIGSLGSLIAVRRYLH